jgi:hypothetical protein
VRIEYSLLEVVDGRLLSQIPNHRLFCLVLDREVGHKSLGCECTLDFPAQRFIIEALSSVNHLFPPLDVDPASQVGSQCNLFPVYFLHFKRVPAPFDENWQLYKSNQ